MQDEELTIKEKLLEGKNSYTSPLLITVNESQEKVFTGGNTSANP